MNASFIYNSLLIAQFVPTFKPLFLLGIFGVQERFV